MFFKETEVSIGKNLSGLISLRNRFKATVKRVEMSDILAKVYLNYKNKEIISIISSRSARKLALAEGDEVEWLVKTNEVSLDMHYAFLPLFLTFKLALTVTAILFVIGVPLAYWIAFSKNRLSISLKPLSACPWSCRPPS